MNEITDSPIGSPAPVLVAVDFGPHAGAAVVLGAEAAARVGADLWLLHVVHDPVDRPGFYRRRQPMSGPLIPVQELAREMASEFLTGLRADHGDLEPLARAQWKMVAGLPQQRILEVCDFLGAGVLVVGAGSEAGGLLARLRPSLAAHLTDHGKVPVVVVGTDPGAAMGFEEAHTLRLVDRAYGALAA